MQADGTKTYSDREPFHYSFAVLSALVEAVGGHAERLDDAHASARRGGDGDHPRGA